MPSLYKLNVVDLQMSKKLDKLYTWLDGRNGSKRAMELIQEIYI
jgi:hypothetical protein